MISTKDLKTIKYILEDYEDQLGYDGASYAWISEVNELTERIINEIKRRKK